MQNQAASPPRSKVIGFIGHILQFTGYVFTTLGETLTPATRTRSESPMSYRHEKGAIKLQETKFFVGLLQDIRHHLLLSKSTQLIYVSMAENFYFALAAEFRKDILKPTEKDFHDYIFSKWPTFNSFRGGPDEIIWGWVEKGYLEPNEVNILSSIVETTAAPIPHSLPFDLYRLIITAVILHEISHAFTKDYFKQIVTPLRVSIDRRGSQRESGWLVEEEIFGGRLCVEWNDQSEKGNMDTIQHVVLTSGPESWVVDVGTATKFLASLQSPMLDWPLNTIILRSHISASGSVRARLTEKEKSESLSTLKTTSVGLGFNMVELQGGGVRSYIGCDRRA